MSEITSTMYIFTCVIYFHFKYLEMRFCKSVRNIVTTLFLFLGMLQMPIFLFVPSLAYSEGWFWLFKQSLLISTKIIEIRKIPVTGQNLFVVNTVVCLCCVTYTMLVRWISNSHRSEIISTNFELWIRQGGIKAVVWTDVVQAFFMVLSIVLVALYGVQQVGGLTVVWDRAVAGGRIFPPM